MNWFYELFIDLLITAVTNIQSHVIIVVDSCVTTYFEKKFLKV